MPRDQRLFAISCAALVLGCSSHPPAAELARDLPLTVTAAPSASTPTPAVTADASASAAPAALPPVPAPARATLASRTSYLSYQDCAITSTGEVMCWSPTTPPALVPGLADVGSLAANDDFTCARTNKGAVRCWGNGPFEQGTTADQPRRIKGLADDVQAISAAAQLFCARRRGEGLSCLTGSSYEGWSTKWTTHPHAQAVARGGSLDCWLIQDGPAICKGSGTPQIIATLPGRYTALAISGWGVHGTAAEVVSVVEAGGKLRWARGRFDGQARWDRGQPGSPAATLVALPRPVVQVGAGVHQLCALLDDGSVYCWSGRPNIDYQDPSPRQSLPERAVEIAVGDAHACARLESGKVVCFGRDYRAEGAQGPRVILGG